MRKIKTQSMNRTQLKFLRKNADKIPQGAYAKE